MKIRLRRLATATTVFLALSLAPTPAIGQSASPTPEIPRLPNGKPDFSGVWARPRVADITRDGRGCGSGERECTQKGSGELPFTPLGAQMDKEPKFDYTAFCLPWGYTRAMQTEYPVEILQTPKRFVYLFESNNIFHVVPTDGRQLPKELDPKWMGTSVGRYEGDTLVIDTVAIKKGPFAMLDMFGTPFSDKLHVVERYRLVDYEAAKDEIERNAKENMFFGTGSGGAVFDPNHRGKFLQLHFTVEDEDTFTTPWTATITYWPNLVEWPDLICAENPQAFYAGGNAIVPHADKPDF